MSYYPKRPIKSFQDLEVYQRLSAAGAVIGKKVAAEINSWEEVAGGGPKIVAGLNGDITSKLLTYLMENPRLLAKAHSLRFADQDTAISHLEKVLLLCNLVVVHLEQFRDLCNRSIEPDFFDEQIKNILTTRGKIFRLQSSWKKFSLEKRN